MKINALSLFFVLLLVFIIPGCGKKEKPRVAPEAVVQKAEKAPEKAAAPGSQAPQALSAPITEERTLFSFESSLDGFEIPMWVEEKTDNAGKSVSISKSFASNGKQSLCLVGDFPGKVWTSATVELEQYLDLSPYRQISADIYLPEGAPMGLRAKLIVTVGDNWDWCEMVRVVPLNPGSWVTVSASIEDGSLEWKRAEVSQAFRSDIRKIDIRIESNKQPVYSGPVYIDNIRVGK